jgi:thiosulfate reductase cytochrome b subunit
VSGLRESRWFALVWAVPVAIVVAVGAVLLARWLRDLPAVAEWLVQYPGHSELPDTAPVGIPAWLGWQHFFNVFFLLLIVRTGWQIRTTKRHEAYWTRNNAGLLRTKNPPTRLSLPLWFHLSLDALWVLNGLIFIVLLFATGQWMRIVPTSWDVIPNAISAGLQYVSLDWPLENGWVNYNALQLLTYFVTVFIAAPLAILTGIRMSPAWGLKMRRVTPYYPMKVARAVHFPVMIWFVAFTAVHVFLVFMTGALRNLNHMYAGRDDESWWGIGIFAGSVVLMVAGWVAARPVVLRSIASLTGKVTR